MRLMGASRSVVVSTVTAGLVAGLVGGAAQWARDSPEGWAVALIGVALTIAGVGWALAGAVLVWHRPRNRLGWVILAVGTVTQFSLTEEALHRVGGPASATLANPWEGRAVGLVLTVVVGGAVFALLGLLPALYPTGALPSSVWVLPAVLVLCGAVLLEVQWLCGALGAGWDWPFATRAERPHPTVVWAPFTIYAAGVLMSWGGCLIRLKRATYPERQQLAWLLFAVALILLVPAVGDSHAGQALQALTLYLLPAAIVLGVLRYRLLDIDTVVRRVIMYAVLTATVAVVHAAVTYLGQSWLGGERLPSVAAAAIVAVGLLPLRERVQGAVDRLFFGRRQEPLAAVSALGDRVAGARQSEILDAVVVEVRSALRAGGARIASVDGGTLTVTGVTPEATEGSVEVPLVAGGQHVGDLSVAARRPGERYSAADEDLIRALAPQVALAVRLVVLARELEDQRDGVVAARHEERERLRRDIHDGLGPSMTGIALGLQALEDHVGVRDVAPAHELTKMLRGEMASTVTEVRRIIEGLRPGPVETVGLVTALRDALTAAGGTRSRVRLHLDTVCATTTAQDAIYRIALEATNNAVRHARADTIRVTLRQYPHVVHLEVSDDGIGIGPVDASRVGLASMQARAEQAGGTLQVRSTAAGTMVSLVLPQSAEPIPEELL